MPGLAWEGAAPPGPRSKKGVIGARTAEAAADEHTAPGQMIVRVSVRPKASRSLAASTCSRRGVQHSAATWWSSRASSRRLIDAACAGAVSWRSRPAQQNKTFGEAWAA